MNMGVEKQKNYTWHCDANTIFTFLKNLYVYLFILILHVLKWGFIIWEYAIKGNIAQMHDAM